MPKPASYPLDIYQGDTYRKRFRLNAKAPDNSPVPLDLTGWTGTSQVRTSVGGTVLIDFTVTIDADQVENPGQFTISATDEVTALLNVTSAVWDVQFEKSGEVRTMLAGPVVITPDVTRTS